MLNDSINSDFFAQCFGLGGPAVDMHKNNVADVVQKVSGEATASAECNLWPF